MDSEYPFSEAELDDALLWPATRLDSEIRSRENMLGRIRTKKEELAEGELMILDQLRTLQTIIGRRVLCVLSEYPIARDKTHIPDEAIITMLEATNGNWTHAAKRLRVDKSYLGKRLRKMREAGIEILQSPHRKKTGEPKLMAVK